MVHRIARLVIAGASLAWQADAGGVDLTVAPDRLDVDSLATEWAALRRAGPSEALFLRRDAWRNARASFRQGVPAPP